MKYQRGKMSHKFLDVSGFFPVQPEMPLPRCEPDYQVALALHTTIDDCRPYDTGDGTPPLEFFPTGGTERNVICKVVYGLQEIGFTTAVRACNISPLWSKLDDSVAIVAKVTQYQAFYTHQNS
jgi:hypothetical protein